MITHNVLHGMMSLFKCCVSRASNKKNAKISPKLSSGRYNKTYFLYFDSKKLGRVANIYVYSCALVYDVFALSCHKDL